MKPLLFVLLAASVAANLVLLLRTDRDPAAARSASSAGSSVRHTSPAAVTSGESARLAAGESRSDALGNATRGGIPHVWRPVAGEHDLHRVVSDLRAAGYPPDVVRAVVNQLLKQHFADREPEAGQPYWKRTAQTPEMVAAKTALSNERRALFESLLGADARPSALLEAETRVRQYGNLTDEKVDAIAKIERDYSEMSAEAWAKSRGNVITSNETMMQTQKLMEQEKLADLAAIMTPAELAEYERRNSSSARSLMNNLRNVEVSETEYNRLYEAQKAFDSAHSMRASMDAATWVQRQAGQLALNEQARAVLGDERFYSYLEGADRAYAQVAQAFAGQTNIAPAAIYQVYSLQNELQATMYQASRGGAPAPDKIAELRTVVESYNARLEALIGVAAADAYRKQGMGRMFSSFRNVTRPATTAPARN